MVQIINIREIIDLLIMTGVVGFIFTELFTTKNLNKRFNWEDYKLSIIVTAPAIIFHEFAHKIAALSLGLNAEFYAAKIWLGLGALLKLIGSPFIFFVPGYVSITTPTTPLIHAIIAFSGPFLNLLLYVAATILLRKENLSHKYSMILILTKKLNLFLFIFNMLPIPPFDGYSVFTGIWQSVF